MDKDIVAEEGDGLGKYCVVVVEGRGDNPVVKDGVSQDVDKEDFSLGNGEMEEVDGDFFGRGVQNRGHNEMGEVL